MCKNRTASRWGAWLSLLRVELSSTTLYRRTLVWEVLTLSSGSAPDPSALGGDQDDDVSAVLTDLSDPGSGLVNPTFSEPRMKATTQRNLAYGSLGVVVVFYGAMLVLRATGVFSQSDLTGIIASFSVIPTLASVAFAFYFATSNRK